MKLLIAVARLSKLRISGFASFAGPRDAKETPPIVSASATAALVIQTIRRISRSSLARPAPTVASADPALRKRRSLNHRPNRPASTRIVRRGPTHFHRPPDPSFKRSSAKRAKGAPRRNPISDELGHAL